MILKKTVIMGAAILLTGSMAFAQTKPFGEGTGIKYGKQPTADQAQMNEDVQTFYDRWTGAANGIELVDEQKPYRDGYLAKYDTVAGAKEMFVVKGDAKGNEPGGWALNSNSANPLEVVSTSEATGYGMIATVLMAGYDSNAQHYFDGLMNTYLNNLTSTTIDYKQLNTMSWVIPDSLYNRDGSAYERTTSSTDGDLDIAYALVLAAEQWETPGPNADTDKTYMELAKLLIQDIHDYLISDDTKRLLMGDWQYGQGIDEATKYNETVTRPSDWMISHLRAFNNIIPSPKWQDAIDEIYRILPIVDVHHKGLVPDFVENISGIPSPVRNVPFLETEHDNKYDNNSCRVPWRMTLDYIHNGGSAPKEYLQRVNAWSADLPQRKMMLVWDDSNWMNGVEGEDWEWTNFPRSVTRGYYLDGVSILQRENGPEWVHLEPYLDFHFVSPIAFAQVASDADNAEVNLDTAWALVNDEWSFGGDCTSLASGPYTCYFGDSITLLEMLIVSGNWWEPQIVPVDEWTPGIFYKPGDEVMYEGNIYVCTYYDVASKPGREPDQPWMWAVWSLK